MASWLAELDLPFPQFERSSAWIEAASLAFAASEPVAAAGLYTQIGSRPDAAYAHLRAARLLLAEDEADAAEAQVAAARNFYGSVDATARLGGARGALQLSLTGPRFAARARSQRTFTVAPRPCSTEATF